MDRCYGGIIMKVAFLYADTKEEWNTSEWRCMKPYIALKNNGYDVAIGHIKDANNPKSDIYKKLADTNIIVVERLLVDGIQAVLLSHRATGKCIIYDVDDSYFHMPRTVLAYPFWHLGIIESGKYKYNIPPAKQLQYGVKSVDAITSPSLLILADWNKYNPYTYYRPNYIDIETYDVPLNNKDNFIVGWGGGSSHYSSFRDSGIVDAIRKIVNQGKRFNITFKINGSKAARNLLPQEKVIFHPWIKHTEWPKELATYNIGLIPLAGQYDRRRSFIKTLEYTLMGIPWIGTNYEPTSEFAEYGTIIENSPKNWCSAILEVANNYAHYKEKVLAGKEFALSWDIKKNTKKIMDQMERIYNETRDQRP